MNFLTRLCDRPEWIAVLVALIALIVTVVYSQVQLSQSTRAIQFNTFTVLRSAYFDTRGEYWEYAQEALSKPENEIVFHMTLAERLFHDHLDSIELFCRLYKDDRLGPDAIQFVNDTIKNEIKTFRSKELEPKLELFGIKSDDIPTC